ncbi:MAG: hypothetical protein A2007_00375 [Verrucomicrobia bacterium GWC2_42_7]|nr:MAG: hypothetical protein A2007_00375 [Verrucomicrobia bacterium GWC2_42_7]
MTTLRKVTLFALLFFTSNAFAWYEEFTTRIGTIVHGDNFIAIGGIRSGRGLNISGGSINGVVLNAPLVLQVGMDRDEFIAAMRTSGILD